MPRPDFFEIDRKVGRYFDDMVYRFINSNHKNEDIYDKLISYLFSNDAAVNILCGAYEMNAVQGISADKYDYAFMRIIKYLMEYYSIVNDGIFNSVYSHYKKQICIYNKYSNLLKVGVNIRKCYDEPVLDESKVALAINTISDRFVNIDYVSFINKYYSIPDCYGEWLNNIYNVVKYDNIRRSLDQDDEREINPDMYSLYYKFNVENNMIDHMKDKVRDFMLLVGNAFYNSLYLVNSKSEEYDGITKCTTNNDKYVYVDYKCKNNLVSIVHEIGHAYLYHAISEYDIYNIIKIHLPYSYNESIALLFEKVIFVIDTFDQLFENKGSSYRYYKICSLIRFIHRYIKSIYHSKIFGYLPCDSACNHYPDDLWRYIYGSNSQVGVRWLFEKDIYFNNYIVAEIVSCHLINIIMQDPCPLNKVKEIIGNIDITNWYTSLITQYGTPTIGGFCEYYGIER